MPSASSPQLANGPHGSPTRERILDVAEALFAQHGLAGTAVRDIAREAGLTPGSLYHYFDGKQALYEAVLERGVGPLLELINRLPSRQHTAEEVEDRIGAIMTHLAKRPHLPRLIHHEAVAGGDSMTRLARAWIRPLIDEAVLAAKRGARVQWDEDELPMVMAAWLHLVFGHFTMAAMLGEILDHDPLSEEGLARQTRFLRKLAQLIHGGES